MLPDAEFMELFRSFQRSCFRLETLPAYDVPTHTDRLNAFLEGKPLPPVSTEHDEWWSIVEAAAAAARPISRVHVIPHKLTPYLRYEIEWGYLYTAERGEQIRLIQHDDPVHFLSDWEAHDFWLFDDEKAARLHYGPNGEYQFTELVEDAVTIAFYGKVRETAVARSMPLQQYLAEVRNS